VDYLLDTNACIALINGSPASVRARLHEALSAGDQIFVSSIAVFQLWYGVAKSSRQDFNRRRVEAFLAGPVVVLPFEVDDAYAAGSIRALLKTSGKPIGAYDVLIAGHALRNELTLVTTNLGEFSGVKGLVRQDWTKR